MIATLTVQEFKVDSGLTFEIVVPPNKNYGKRLENGSWYGMMAQLASRVSFIH
ncbi:hypothetical protein E2C01_060323 [Portunus trituberculatus]|uniref:Ionotropic glutamate receptor L-glutamate and glycine-binding domain-containing protein n=1 Tax=Portunus trituberculatus TaxID=210409 RepID=A0A5B7HA53_PORTR|nr:hypothetical protein [Portunus trituberculatus]